MIYRSLFNFSIGRALKAGQRVTKGFPESAGALRAIADRQPEASRRRLAWERQGVAVPPLLIISATERCNLHCAGCYSHAKCHASGEQFSRAQMDNLLSQAVAAGCSMVLLAGGEPLLCRDWLEALAAKPALFTLVFTNGTLLDDSLADWFRQHRSVFPMFSVEGGDQKTDDRRGAGVAGQVREAMQRMRSRGIPFGISVTVNEENFCEVTSPGFLPNFYDLGCRLGIFVEYVPMSEADKKLALSKNHKRALYWFTKRLQMKQPMLRVAFPGNERLFGGCLAAGRGFVHVSASGDLEPCPFASTSDRSVRAVSLIDALRSPMLKQLRDNAKLLHEGDVGGCALRGDQAQALLAAVVRAGVRPRALSCFVFHSLLL